MSVTPPPPPPNPLQGVRSLTRFYLVLFLPIFFGPYWAWVSQQTNFGFSFFFSILVSRQDTRLVRCCGQRFKPDVALLLTALSALLRSGGCVGDLAFRMGRLKFATRFRQLTNQPSLHHAAAAMGGGGPGEHDHRARRWVPRFGTAELARRAMAAQQTLRPGCAPACAGPSTRLCRQTMACICRWCPLHGAFCMVPTA